MTTETYIGSTTGDPTITYNFSGGISISNDKGKGYATGLSSIKSIKYSAGVKYTIQLPKGLTVDKIKFYGYDNYADADAYISTLNGTNYNSTEYVFPAKDAAGNATLTSHTFDFSEQPVQGTIEFIINGKQCGLAITLYSKDSTSGIENTLKNEQNNVKKFFRNGQLLLIKDGISYNAAGQIVEQNTNSDKL